MRQRTRMEIGVALIERVNVGVIAMAHKEQIAVAQHRALWSAGRPTRVEKPRPVGRRAVDRAHRHAACEEVSVIAGSCRDYRRQCLDRSIEDGEGAVAAPTTDPRPLPAT